MSHQLELSPSRLTLIWFAVVLFSLLQFMLQISGNLLVGPWMKSFHISDAWAGLLGSAFFWTYIIVQIPAGFLLDLFDPRRVLTIASLVLAAGVFLFGFSNSYWLAFVARLVMGLGAGFGFIGMVFSIASFFPEKHFATLLGLGELLGLLGSSIGQYFAPHLVLHYNWRVFILLMGCLILLISLFLYAVLSTKKRLRTTNFTQVKEAFWRAVTFSLRSKTVWCSGLFCLGAFLMLTVFGDLWGVPFLRQMYQLDYLQATHLMIYVLMGIAIGGPVLGRLVDKTKRLKMVAGCATLFAVFALLFLVYDVPFSTNLLPLFLFVAGFSSSIYLLAFLVITTSTPVQYHGTATAVCNAISLLGAIILQPLIGHLLDGFSSRVMAYQVAFAILPILMVAGFLALVLVRLKHGYR